MTNKERIEDLLIEFDELDMQPMLIVPNPTDRAKAWKDELIYAIEHLEADLAREIFTEIEKAICGITAKNVIECTFEIDRTEYIELKKKYTEGDNG